MKKLKKIVFSVVFVLSTLSAGSAFAGNHLLDQCNSNSGSMLYKKVISRINASTDWASKGSAVNIRMQDNDVWYGLSTTNNYNVYDLTKSFFILGTEVNVCVLNGYLIGVESSD